MEKINIFIEKINMKKLINHYETAAQIAASGFLNPQ